MDVTRGFTIHVLRWRILQVFDKIFSVLGGNLFAGVADVIKTFVADPTERAKAELAIQTLQLNVKLTFAVG